MDSLNDTRVGPAEAQNSVGVSPHEWQGCNHLSHPLLTPTVCSRRLELGAEPSTPGWDVSMLTSILSTALNPCPFINFMKYHQPAIGGRNRTFMWWPMSSARAHVWERTWPEDKAGVAVKWQGLSQCRVMVKEVSLAEAFLVEVLAWCFKLVH